jgi:hypothetical protein
MVPEWFSTDPWMQKTYVHKVYNCFDFARDVWLELTGEDIRERLEILRTPIASRKATRRDIVAFQKALTLSLPSRALLGIRGKVPDPALVMFRRPRIEPHIGVYVRGKLLHLTRKRGVMHDHLQVVAIGFDKVAFYT